MTPDDFARHFAAAYGRQDAGALAAMLAPDADVLTLTGALVEGADAAKAVFDDEFAGTFAASRLVTGKMRLRVLGPELTLLTQRFVVSGARDASGQDMPRFGAILTAVLVVGPEGWLAVNLGISALA